MQVILHGPGLSQNSDLSVDHRADDEPDQAVITSKKDPSIEMRIALPTPVCPAQAVPLVTADLHLEAKLAAVPKSSSSIVSMGAGVNHALCAVDLREAQPRALCCASCEREVADLSRVTRKGQSGFSDLPSEHWAEMMEVWMCHADPTWTARLAQKTKEGFWPSQSTVLVGGSYLLVHENDVKSLNLNMEHPVKVSACFWFYIRRATRRSTSLTNWWSPSDPTCEFAPSMKKL